MENGQLSKYLNEIYKYYIIMIIDIKNTEYLITFLKNDIPKTFRYFNNKTPDEIIKIDPFFEKMRVKK
jgi:hypothetical protein